jgi:hypothetical protein
VLRPEQPRILEMQASGERTRGAEGEHEAGGQKHGRHGRQENAAGGTGRRGRLAQPDRGQRGHDEGGRGVLRRGREAEHEAQ